MSTISDVRESRGMVSIDLDGIFWLRIARKYYALCPVDAGTEVDSEQYIDRLAELQAKDCYEAALCILDRSDHASGELRNKLTRKGYVLPAVQAAVDRLQECGLINDAQYAQRLAKGQQHRCAGAYAVRRKLMAKQIPQEAIESAMEEFSEDQQREACKSVAEKLWHKYAALPSRQGRAKLSQALARRGFSWDAIHCAVEAICEDCFDFEGESPDD